MVITVGAPLYAWDADRRSDGSFMDELAADLDYVAIAAMYHAVTAGTPRGHHRRYHREHTSAVFVDGIEGVPRGDGDWAMAAEAARARGMGAHAWLVLGHLDGILTDAPRIVNATGDLLEHGLCLSAPSNATLIADLAESLVARTRPDGLLLEGLAWQGTGHGSLHDKTAGLRFTAAQHDLAAICFCEHCCTRFAAAGVDVDTTRAQVKSGILEASHAPVDDLDLVRSTRQLAQEAFATIVIDAVLPHVAIDDITVALGPGPGSAVPGGGSVLVDCWGTAERARENLRDAPPATGRSVIAHVDVVAAMPADVLERSWLEIAGSADGFFVYHPGLVTQDTWACAAVAIRMVRADRV